MVHADLRNTRPLITGQIQDLIDFFGWDIIGHPAYSPDLALIDFHLFCLLKHQLGGKRFDNKKVEAAVTTWLSEQAADFYLEGFQYMVKRYDKCLNKKGSHVEIVKGM